MYKVHKHGPVQLHLRIENLLCSALFLLYVRPMNYCVIRTVHRHIPTHICNVRIFNI